MKRNGEALLLLFPPFGYQDSQGHSLQLVFKNQSHLPPSELKKGQSHLIYLKGKGQGYKVTQCRLVIEGGQSLLRLRSGQGHLPPSSHYGCQHVVDLTFKGRLRGVNGLRVVGRRTLSGDIKVTPDHDYLGYIPGSKGGEGKKGGKEKGDGGKGKEGERRGRHEERMAKEEKNRE